MANGDGSLDLPPHDDSAPARQLPPLAGTIPVSGDGERAPDPSKEGGEVKLRQAAARRASLLSYHMLDGNEPAMETETDMDLPGTPSKEPRPSDSRREEEEEQTKKEGGEKKKEHNGEGRQPRQLAVNSGWASEDPAKWGSSYSLHPNPEPYTLAHAQTCARIATQPTS